MSHYHLIYIQKDKSPSVLNGKAIYSTINSFPGGSNGEKKKRKKKLPAMRETQVRCLDREDPLEKSMATHSSILAWGTLWTEEPGRLQSMGLQRVRHAKSD